MNCDVRQNAINYALRQDLVDEDMKIISPSFGLENQEMSATARSKYGVTTDELAFNVETKTAKILYPTGNREDERTVASYAIPNEKFFAELQVAHDQYHYVLSGLDCFFKIAARAERDLIQTMVDRMTRFWINRNYTRNYFGKPLKWPLNRFTGFAYLNYVYTGDKDMLRELNRLAALEEVWPAARTNFVGEAWAASWADWEPRHKKLQKKIEAPAKSFGAPRHQP